MSGYGDEYKVVEKRVLHLLDKLGYQICDVCDDAYPDPPARDNYHQVILQSRLRQKLTELNPWLAENKLPKVINRIRPARINATDLLDGNETIYQKLVQHTSVRQDLGQGKKNQTVKYIDFEAPERNEFLAVNQFPVHGVEEIIPDIVLFINGIPIGVIECKHDGKCDEPEQDAIAQLRRYQNLRYSDQDAGAEKLFYPVQILAAAWRGSASSATVGAPARAYQEWKDPYPVTQAEVQELVEQQVTLQDILIYSQFKPDNLLDLIQNFIVFENEDGQLTKMVARYQQFRAVNKTLTQIKDGEAPAERHGTIWHTQGSGKSLSMLFLALKLKRISGWNPTMLIVTDRKALDSQIAGTFERCGFPNPEQAEGVEDLKAKITSDAGNTIMTTVHKFQEEERDKYPVLTESEEVFVLVDEAHRTQYKELAANMRRALPNATYLGFTGTPIEKEERNTRRTFGDYIDTYTIEEAVEDEVTLPIKYEGRLADLRVEGRELDKIFDRVFSDYDKEERQLIKQKYATPRKIAEAEPRIERICLDILEHYEAKIKPLKAQIVAVSKEAAATYKEKLSELNGPESAVIFSSDKNRDSARVKQYTKSDSEIEQLKQRFKDDEDELTFIIVCDMLLTGFDAPVEQVMYLDKPLKEHNLLQAIARVNRRFEEKNYGLVVDYYGVFDYLQEALAIFNKEDVANAVTPIEEEKPRLERRHRRAMSYFRDVDFADLEACVLALKDEAVRANFKRDFKAFSKSMDIVMPNPLADPYREDLQRLGQIYKAARNRYRDDRLNVSGVGDKVKRLIDKHIRAADIRILNEPVSILDKEKFDEVIAERSSEEAKASEMEHAIRNEISVKLEENPVFYQSLRDRLEDIIQQVKQERLEFAQAVEEMREIITEIRGVKSKAEKLGLDERELALYELLLDNKGLASAEETAEDSGTYDAGTDQLEIKLDNQVKELTTQLMANLEELTVVDWQRKETVLKDMRREIKVNLIKHKEFKQNYQTLTTEIMKLAQNIL